MSKIKILYIVSNLTNCGPINVLYNIVKYINQEKFEVHILCLSKESKNSRLSDFISLGIKVKNLNYDGFKNLNRASEYINSYIIDESIDIIHSHGIRGDYINSKLKSCKGITTLHNYPYNDYTMTYGKIKGSLMAYIHIKLLKNIDMVCACSKTVSRLFYKKNNMIIPYVQNGVDNEKFKKVSNEIKLDIRKELNLPIKNKIFISVGNIIKGKDPLTIIECFKMRKENDETLVILGDGDLYDECKRNAEGFDNIIFRGRVNNVVDYMKASDYYISASLAEGLPNTVMEALSSGLPVILSDIEPHSEIMENNDRISYLFKVRNSKELNKNINDIRKTSYEKISKYAISIIENNLSATIMSNKYQNKYEELMEL